MIKNYDIPDVTFEQVREAYLDCRKNKKNSDRHIEYESDLEVNLVNLYRDLKDRTWYPGKSFTFVVTRPQPREVFAACFNDRIVHHLLIRQIEDLFEDVFIEDIYSCRSGKGALYGVNCLSTKLEEFSNNYTKKVYVAKFDLKGFFMSIDKEILCRKLTDFLRKNYPGKNLGFLIWIARSIILHCPENNCEYRGDPNLKRLIPKEKSLFYSGETKGLPIGNLTSQVFANFYLHEFDILASRWFKGGYGRYVDDFFVISETKRQIRKFRKFAKKYLQEELGVNLHTKKFYTQDIRKGVKFIGYVVKPGRIYIGNMTVANFHHVIEDMNLFIRKDHNSENKNIVPILKHFESQWNSYIGFMIHSSSYNLRKEAWENLDHRWRKYITRDPRFIIRLRKRYRFQCLPLKP